MKKFNIYTIHSSKLNYKEEFYRPLLLSEVCTQHNLILPLTDKYKTMYAKDLINESDVVIINLTNATFSVFIETKWTLKFEKPHLFLIKENAKINFLLNKYKKEAKIYQNTEQEKEIINNYITTCIEEISSKDESGTINLGNITKS